MESHILSTASAVAALGACAADFSTMTDDALLAAQKVVAEHSRAVDQRASWVAAEIARRSARELGHSGLAARQGFRSPEELIQNVSHISRGEAAKLVSVGLTSSSSSSEVEAVGIDVLDAINRGLGSPSAVISAAVLQTERARLLAIAPDLTTEELFRAARARRDRLDEESVSLREQEQRDRRYWRNSRRQDGMVAGSYLLAPEDGALLTAAFQNIVSPRRNGPRFDAATPSLVDDPRTTDQVAADALVAIVQLAVDADPGEVFGVHKPAVTVVVRKEDLAAGTGHGVLDDSHDAISLRSVERMACASGVVEVLFDSALQAVDLGRTQRLHSRAQRRMIAARDGGCMFPSCNMPVSMTQVHHPDNWKRDGGGTSVENGILLCAFHHLMLHNNGWNITYAGGRYWLVPPPDVDPGQRAILLETKNPLLKRTG